MVELNRSGISGIAALSVFSLTVACSEEEVGSDCSFDGGEIHSILVSSMIQVYPESGISRGFDLDHRISDGTDMEGCYHRDLQSPDGIEGIDNSHGALFPYLEAAESTPDENILVDGFTNEIIPFIVRISGVHDHLDDNCIEVAAFYAQGPIIYGSDGEILDGQTLSAVEFAEPIISRNARIENGTLFVDDFPFFRALFLSAGELPPGAMPEMGALEMPFEPSGFTQGLIGAAIPVGFMYAFFDSVSFTDLLNGHISRGADLAPDENGICQQISSTYQFEGIPAHLLGD
jgi:hypothetical protein